ncbi:hypothetical protein [Catellatospora vulcania]|uniref:hypothetical protein n=1 Tax=Catellatospora vulcania TaxID=1460450 RepID=UPI0012D41DC5|nr:hypothetical protein [Catellatospora vulcania]
MTNPVSSRPVIPYVGIALVAVCAAYFGFQALGIPGIVAVVLIGSLAVVVGHLWTARAGRRRVPQQADPDADRRTALRVAWLGAAAAVLAAVVTTVGPPVVAAVWPTAQGGKPSGDTTTPPSIPVSATPSTTPSASAVVRPILDKAACDALDIDVDTLHDAVPPVDVGYAVNARGLWRAEYETGRLRLFVTGGGTTTHFPYVGEIVRDGDYWIAWGLPIGRKGVTADTRMGVRVLEVVVLSEADDKALRAQTDAPDFWSKGGSVNRLPASARSVARVPLQRVC